MKKYIDKLKEIDTLVEFSIGDVMTEEKATEIYGLTNELMCMVKKSPLNIIELKSLLHKFKKEELPDAEIPFHYEAEIWAGMEHLVVWLENGKIYET